MNLSLKSIHYSQCRWHSPLLRAEAKQRLDMKKPLVGAFVQVDCRSVFAFSYSRHLSRRIPRIPAGRIRNQELIAQAPVP